MTADKQCGSGSIRVYFGVVLSRGVLGVAVFTDVAQFPGETPGGARLLVERLPGVLDEMLGCSSKKRRTLCSPTAGLGSTTGDGGRSQATTSLLAASTDSNRVLERIQRGALVLSRPMWLTSSYTRPPFLGCGAWRSGHGHSGLGRRHLASWRSACSKLCAGSIRSTTCVLFAWVCLTGSVRLARHLGTGCLSECGRKV